MPKLKKTNTEQKLFTDIAGLIEQSKNYVAQNVNATLTFLYWKIGKRINEDILKNKRAEYGKKIVASLTRQLEKAYGKGYDEKSIRRMMQFASVFTDEKIVASVMRQLSWTHITLLLPLKQPLQREFYAEMCRAEGNHEQIEFLQLHKSGIKVAEYLTELPSKKTLRQKLHKAIEVSRKMLENKL